ncbi:nad dependent epimerase [Teratosphaeria destructans]|uniref:Nad dependent epimerase n=1 Tax=Teratosphaeria destructans TaxID=418781 RepID=A0A9W7SV61_9PEZI|nr:nad dependent epimerase [Teratosphaeria destructans]
MTGQTILISGASGFVASHVVRAFLEKGYNVKGTVRSESTAQEVRKSHPSYESQLSFAIVEDIARPRAFDEAVKGVHGVIHTASPFTFDVQDFEKDLLIPAVNGTNSILQAVEKYNPIVKRVVITSSFAALINISKGAWPEHTYNEADWNPDTYETAKNGPGLLAYCTSKKLAEEAAFKFLREKNPAFSIATVCPPLIYGPIIHHVSDISKLNSSSVDIYRFVNGSTKEVPSTDFPAFVDVRDVAQAHIKAYEKPEAANQRYFTTGGNFTYQEVVDIIHEHFPELKEKTPVGEAGEKGPKVFKVDTSKAQKELGIKFRGLEEVIVDTVRGLLKLEEETKK